MAKSRASQSVSPKVAGAVIVLLLGFFLFVFLLLQQVNFLVGRSLLIAFGNGADTTYKGAWFDWNGDLVAKDFRLKPYGPDVDVTLSFGHIRVDTPGWLWVIGTMRSRKLVADTDRLHVILEGGDANDIVDPSLGDLGPFGVNTASPFEAEGCLLDSAWLRSELTDMGLQPGPTTLEFDYQVRDSKLDSRIVLDIPRVSRVTLVRHENLPGKINPYLLDLTETATTDEHWVVEDQGFVKARNAWCAKRDKATPAEVASRHVAAVQRLLAIQGLALDAQTWLRYADFAANGGTLSFGGSYSMPLSSETYYDDRDSGIAFTRMNGIVERKGEKLLAQWSRVTPRPLAGLDTLATYAAMVKEGGVPAAAVPATTTAATPEVAAPPAAAPVAAPLAASVAASATPVQSPAKPAVPPAPAAALKLGDELAWADLSKAIGHEVEITTVHTPSRIVTVVEAGKGEATVDGSVQGGHVRNRIHPDGFIRAVFLR